MLIITNGEPLGKAVARIVYRTLGKNLRVFRLTYSNCVCQLTMDLLDQTDFFVLELFRQYPGGLRVEGISLAQRLAKNGKPALIVAPLFLAMKLNCKMYWDTSSDDCLSDRIRLQLLKQPPDPTEINQLANFFAPLLALPPQHQIIL